MSRWFTRCAEDRTGKASSPVDVRVAGRGLVKRIGLTEKGFHFKDQAGKVAFIDKFMSIGTGSKSPAANKAMVDRAAGRGWETVRLNGSPEFVPQGWIAATAQGLKAVGHTATDGDHEAASKERTRAHGGHRHLDAGVVEHAGQRVVVDAEFRVAVLLLETPDLAPTGDRRFVVEVHLGGEVDRLTLEQHRDDDA